MIWKLFMKGSISFEQH